MQTATSISSQFLTSIKDKMVASPVMHHTFLIAFESRYLEKSQLQKFAIQWYKTAKGHKEAFPAIVYNTKDDDVRFDLIDILNEEYGNGDREKIHAKLLKRLLIALRISERTVEETETLPGVRYFSEEVSRIWRDGDPIYAFGLHFALEFLASSLHVHFANGLDKYSFLTEHDKEYFNYHKTAEKQHADFSESGFLHYAAEEESHALLSNGVDKAIELMSCLWDDFHRVVLEGRPAVAA